MRFLNPICSTAHEHVRRASHWLIITPLARRADDHRISKHGYGVPEGGVPENGIFEIGLLHPTSSIPDENVGCPRGGGAIVCLAAIHATRAASLAGSSNYNRIPGRRHCEAKVILRVGVRGLDIGIIRWFW